MKTIKLICMAFDGDYVTDSEHNNIDDAIDASANIGSKWFFYPFHFILSGSKVIETGQGLIRMSDKKAYSELMFKGRKFQTVINTFKKTFVYCMENEIEENDLYEFENIMIETNHHLIR